MDNKPWTVEELREFRQAALADGWTSEPIYKNEPEEQASNLHKDGFIIMVIDRPETQRGHITYPGHHSISAWGPHHSNPTNTGSAIRLEFPYNWEQIKNAVRDCLYCNAKNVNVFSVGFAGRACADCLPEQERKEFYGWTN